MGIMVYSLLWGNAGVMSSTVWYILWAQSLWANVESTGGSMDLWDLRAAKEDEENPLKVQDWVAIPHSLAGVFAFKPILAQKPAFR